MSFWTEDQKYQPLKEHYTFFGNRLISQLEFYRFQIYSADLLIYQQCVRTDVCVMSAWEQLHVKYGITNLCEVGRNVCKYKHTSEHAYAENLEVE